MASRRPTRRGQQLLVATRPSGGEQEASAPAAREVLQPGSASSRWQGRSYKVAGEVISLSLSLTLGAAVEGAGGDRKKPRRGFVTGDIREWRVRLQDVQPRAGWPPNHHLRGRLGLTLSLAAAMVRDSPPKKE
uniref:Uncharacterized protein n=1 Tax=Oryza punctata TaxID=4537 RepID=A0A0E0M6V0_ORYPU